MDQIAEQLRTEIQSLEEHIKRSGNRLLVTHWVDDLIEPFEQIEDTLDADDLRTVVTAIHHARNHFRVNGHLADRLDDILARHAGLISDLTPAAPDLEAAAYENVMLPPDADPGDTMATDEAGSLFIDEDHEDDDAELVSPVNIDFGRDDEIPADSIDFGKDADLEVEGASIDFGTDEDEDASTVDFGRDHDKADEADGVIDFGRDEPTSDAPGISIDFGADDAAAEPLVANASPDQDAGEIKIDFGGQQDTAASAPGSDMPSGSSDDLFAGSPPGAKVDTQARGGTPSRTGQAEDKSRVGSLKAPAAQEAESLFSIFSHRISVDDLAAGLDINISAQDRTFLEQKLKAKLNDRVVAALRASKSAEKQYILMPRIPRAIESSGTPYP